VRMTSIALEGGAPDMDAVADVVLAAFAARFGFERLAPLAADEHREAMPA